MSSSEEIYEELLQIYAEEYSNPKSVLNYHIELLTKDGKTREEAVLRLYLQKTKDDALKQAIEHDIKIEEQIGKLREKLSTFTVLFSKGEITEPSYKKAVAEIEANIEKLRKEEKIVQTKKKELGAHSIISEPSVESVEASVTTGKSTSAFLNWKDAAKYFIHGAAFSVLFLLLAFVWVLMLAVLVGLGFIIGLMIGIGLLFMIVGFLNSAITSYLWFEVKTSLSDLLFHGIALSLILLITNVIFLTIPSLVFPGPVTAVTTFIVGSFLDGFVAKNVAKLWEGGSGNLNRAEAEWRDRNL